MSYQVLARKWRPHNFSEVIGQEHVLTALSNALTQNRVHHAYLFSGTRGVGKTTIARILAKSLNCEQGVTATPCGTCEFCQSIDAGHFVDLLEIDAASRTKVDDTREMLDNVQYKPTVGRYKVYLIDEVHMLSKHSFNALLKTLEEPPEYVKFLLATTDPQKLPVTVLSRCLQFHLKALLPEQIEKQLRYILEQENATFDGASLIAIANAADGSMRDALSLTDQALAFGSGNIKYQDVLKMLGTIDNHHLHYLLHFIASGDVEKVFAKIQEFVHLGADFAKLHQELATLCHQTALLQMLNRPHDVQKNTLQLFADRLSAEELQLYYQIAVQGYKDYAFAPNGKIAFEMTVMRLLAFKPAKYIALDESQLDTLQGDSIGALNLIDDTQPLEMPVESNMTPVAKPVVNKVSIPDTLLTEPLVEPTAELSESIIKDESVPNLDNKLPEVAPESDTLQDASELAMQSVEQLTHSRNMLRSHRLKRSKSKKPLATTSTKDDTVVVASVEKEKMKSVRIPNINHVDMPPVEHKNMRVELENRHFAEVDMPGQQLSSSLDVALQEAWQVDEQDKHDLSTCALIQDDFVAPSYFIDDEKETIQIDGAQYVQNKLTDPWSLLIQTMQLVGLVKLLAKNCVFKQVDNQVILTLCRQQQHLLNNTQLCEQLQKSLKAQLGQKTTMYIEIGEVPGKLSAFELESNIFQKCVEDAKQAICDDVNIQNFVDDYDAKIYANSIIPL